MIDLRSDTVTKPTKAMLKAMYQAELGDDGRTAPDGKGEDPTVRKLEELAASITGKEDALFCTSGTMANHVALLTYTERGDGIAVDPESHIYKSEQAMFLDSYFGRRAVFFTSDERGVPLPESIKELPIENLKVLSLENTFSMKGGASLTAEETRICCEAANEVGIPVHLDGARIFNAASFLNTSVQDLTAPVSSIQFCLSKGLGSPIGSVLCGEKSFIRKARQVRKLIGGGMRQAGVLAAAGIVALNNKESVRDDNKKAVLLQNLIQGEASLFRINDVQSNILLLDLEPSGLTARDVERNWAKQGLLVKIAGNNKIRLTLHKDVTEQDIRQAARIIRSEVT